MIDFSQNRQHLKWAETRLGVDFSATPAVWLTSLKQDGTILGVVVFSRFTVTGCEASMALTDNPVGSLRSLRDAVFAYAFMQCEYQRLTVFVAVGNEKSLDLAQRLGFRKEGLCRDWFPESDAFILGLLRRDFSWNRLKDSHGQPEPTTST